MPDKPTHATIPPTPVIATTLAPRPTLGTVNAIILFCFAMLEAAWAVFMCGALLTFIQIGESIRSLAGSVPATHLLAQQAQYALIGCHIVFAVFYIIHGIALLRVRPGIIRRIIVTLIARVIVINGIWLFVQWCISQIQRSPLDATATAVLTGSNLLFYIIVTVLLTRPSMCKAYAKEQITPSKPEIQ